MERSFSPIFRQIIDFYRKSNHSIEHGKSRSSFARFVNVSTNKMYYWDNLGQWPSAEDLLLIHQKLGISPLFLLSGEGEMIETPAISAETPKNTPKEEPETSQNEAVSLIGFASCGIMGWQGVMTYPIPVDPPRWHGKMFAVMASGESMIPAGIGHGHICYCDPTVKPSQGEAVYVEQKTGAGGIKTFCGWSSEGGEDFVTLRGWLNKKEGQESQQIFDLKIDSNIIKTIAPVIYVRRRL